ncbi:MAG: hypothetical protein AAB586_00665 [Patescibacteria group bacterium]
MKKIIVIVIIIICAVLVLSYVVRNNFLIDTNKIPITSETSSFQPDPSNATFTLDNESITLAEGKNVKSVVPGSALVEETSLMDKFAYGDINADDKEDTALFLARYGGGSGLFIYLAVFVSGPVTYKGSRAIFIGDRITPQSLSIKEDVITVKYLDRKDGEAFTTEPTVLVSKQFVFKNGELQEK